jgi:predicted membrane channel-forming protein YqfA (hemolysin III family)
MSGVKRFALSLIPAFIAGAVVGVVLYAFNIEAKSTLGMVLIALAAIGVLSITWGQTKSPRSN